MPSLLFKYDSNSFSEECYRTLRTNLQFSFFDKDLKSIIVTSAGPGEGKSTVISNLALTIAQSGKRVLLIDCDLRKPSIHKKFNISNLNGLTNLLAQDKKAEDVVIRYKQNVDILTSGTIPPNPSEILSSNKMKLFISTCIKEYDFVLMDTPPVTLVTDAQILSSMADGVLYVVCLGKTGIEDAVKGKKLLNNVNAKILGIVMNKCKNERSRKYGYYCKTQKRRFIFRKAEKI